MTFLKRFRQYYVYRRLLLSYFLLAIITISLVSTVLYLLFSAKVLEETERSSQQMLTQVSYTANLVFNQIEDLTNQLVNDSQITTFLYAKPDKMVNYNAKLTLIKVQSVYPFISNISLFNFVYGHYIDAAGFAPQRQPPVTRHVQYFQFFPREINQDGSPPIRLLTFEIFPLPSFNGTAKSAIQLDLKESYIQNTIRGIGSLTGSGSTFVMDDKGVVLSHSDPQYFMKSFANQAYVKKVLSDGQKQGSFVQEINSRKSLVTFVKSTTLDWYFISVRPYSEIMSNVHTLRNWTMFVAAILFVMGAITSLIVTGNLYNPIKSLVDKVSERTLNGKNPSLLRLDEYNLLSEVFTHTLATAKTMESDLQRSNEVMKNSYLFHAVKGNTEQKFPPEIEQFWQLRLTGSLLTVLLLKIDSIRNFKQKYNSMDRGLIRFAITNISQELLGQVFMNHLAFAEEDEIVLVLQSERFPLDDRLYLTLAEIQAALKKFYNITVSISIGDPCLRVQDLRQSYQSARDYMSQRLFRGHGAILDASAAGSVQESPARYPLPRERKLIDVIKLCQPKSIQKEIDEWIQEMERGSYWQAIQYTNFLILAVIREFDNATEWWGLDPQELYAPMKEIHDAETLDELKKCLLDFCFRIVNVIEENKNKQAAVKIARVVEEVKQFLHERYADPGLSLDLAADHVGLSPGYISKLFKSVTGSSFNDYVTSIRMEKARDLLLNETETVAQIAEKVGMVNISYFSTLFKKKYGMPPTQFREQSRLEA